MFLISIIPKFQANLENGNFADNHISESMTMTMLGPCPCRTPSPSPHPLSNHSQDCPVLSSPLQKAFVCLVCSLSVAAAASVNGDNNFLNWNWMKWFAYNIIYTMNANKLRRSRRERDENEMRPGPWPFPFRYCFFVACRLSHWNLWEISLANISGYISFASGLQCRHFAHFHCFHCLGPPSVSSFPIILAFLQQSYDA